MSAVETLRAVADQIEALEDTYEGRISGHGYSERWDGYQQGIADAASVARDRLDALASTLAHVDPAVLDLAAVVAADVAEAPLPDGWTAVVNRPGSVEVVASGGIQWVWVESDGAHWVSDTGGAYAHLADVVAAVTGAGS